MQRRSLIALAALLVLAPAAHASEDAKAPKKDVGQYVDLQPIALPIVADGRLVNYVFVNIRLNLTTSANVAKLREKEPYFRDALVRVAHKTSFTAANDYQKVDEPRLIAAMTREAVAIVGSGQIKSVTITSQASQKRVSPPKPAAPAAA